MEQLLKFTVQTLLLENKDGSVSGPMSAVVFAKEMAQQMKFKYNRIARVWFEDEEIFQQYEDDGLTGHDTLIIGCQYENDLWLSLWVDSGTGGLAAAMCYQSDREAIFSPVYHKTTYARKLTETEIKQIFEYVFVHPESIAIKPLSK